MVSVNSISNPNIPIKLDMDFMFDIGYENPDEVKRRLKRKERQNKIDELLKKDKSKDKENE